MNISAPGNDFKSQIIIVSQQDFITVCELRDFLVQNLVGVSTLIVIQKWWISDFYCCEYFSDAVPKLTEHFSHINFVKEAFRPAQHLAENIIQLLFGREPNFSYIIFIFASYEIAQESFELLQLLHEIGSLGLNEKHLIW